MWVDSYVCGRNISILLYYIIIHWRVNVFDSHQGPCFNRLSVLDSLSTSSNQPFDHNRYQTMDHSQSEAGVGHHAMQVARTLVDSLLLLTIWLIILFFKVTV